jgi:tetratricopeptide (TPR) repeat protein
MFSGQENSTGDLTVIKKLALQLALLAVPIYGFGQQDNSSGLDDLLTGAQRAQARGDYALATRNYMQAVLIEPAVPELWANLGLMQQAAGQYNEAVASFLQANRLNSSLYVPNLFLGIDYAHSGKVQSAITFLAKAEELNRADPQAPLALGRAYISTGRVSAAIQQLDHATNLAPKLGAAWFALGIAHLDLVEDEARIISEENKGSPFARALYAESLQKQARFGEAASLYKTLLNARPQLPCLGSELGFALLRNHDPSGAEEQFAAERSAHPACSLAILGQIRIAIANGDNHRAIGLLDELWNRDQGFVRSSAAILLDGTFNDATATNVALLSSEESATLAPDLRNALSAAFGLSDPEVKRPEAHAPDGSQMDQTPEASYTEGHFLACARQLEPSVARLKVEKLHLLAECAESTGNDALALRAASALNRLQPNSAEALYWSIRANERLAMQSLARFQQLDPDSAASHVLLGDIYHQLERNDDAQTEYLKALKLSPGDPAALLGVSTAYLSNGNLPAAAEAAQSALSKRPDDPDINFLMAEIELGRHSYASALPYLGKCLHSNPEMLPNVHALIGKVYAETDRTQEAIQELKLGASGDEDGSIHYLLARLYRRQGDTKDADVALDRMKAIKAQRHQRGYKLIEDPELDSIESEPEKPITP